MILSAAGKAMMITGCWTLMVVSLNTQSVACEMSHLYLDGNTHERITRTSLRGVAFLLPQEGNYLLGHPTKTKAQLLLLNLLEPIMP